MRPAQPNRQTTHCFFRIASWRHHKIIDRLLYHQLACRVAQPRKNPGSQINARWALALGLAIGAADLGCRQRLCRAQTGCDGAVREERILAQVTAAFQDGSAAWLSAGDVQRMLVATQGDQRLAVTKLREAVRWKRDTLDTWRAQEAEKLQSAETRIIAIGEESRPLVYSGCVNQRKGEVAGRILACIWDQALQAAGPTAQLDYILDAHGYQPLLNLNVLPYLSIARHIDSYFAERFHRIIIVDIPEVLVLLIKAILPLMPLKTRQKVVFLRRDRPETMDALYDLCVDGKMRAMVEELLQMNGQASSSAGREASHALTRDFLEKQRSTSKLD